MKRHPLYSVVSVSAAIWILVVALCPPMFRMHCMTTGRVVVSLYTPANCAPLRDAPAEDSMSPQCCEISMVASVKEVYEPLALAQHSAPQIAVPVVLVHETLPCLLERPMRLYGEHGPPRSPARDAQVGLGVFRI